MKKLVIGVIVLSIGAAILAGCGSKNVSIDVKALGNDLNTKIAYQDELMELDLESAGMFLNLSDVSVVNSAIYEGSGATAEEIVVLECADANEAAKAKKTFEERVEEQKESFADYVPEELTKLDAAVIVTADKYAVLSVSDDAAGAKSIIDSYVN